MRWRSNVKEHSPKIHYIERKNNILADNLSRLQRLPKATELAGAKDIVQPSIKVAVDKLDTYFNKDGIDACHIDVNRSGATDLDINDVLDCCLNLTEMEVIEESPLNYAHISELQ